MNRYTKRLCLDLGDSGGSSSSGGDGALPERTLFVSPSWSQTPDADQQFTTIDDAIAQALVLVPTTNSRIIIFIYPGTYVEDVTLPEFVFLRSYATDLPTIGGTLTVTGAPTAVNSITGIAVDTVLLQGDVSSQLTIRECPINTISMNGPQALIHDSQIGQISGIGFVNAVTSTIFQVDLSFTSTGIFFNVDGSFWTINPDNRMTLDHCVVSFIDSSAGAGALTRVTLTDTDIAFGFSTGSIDGGNVTINQSSGNFSTGPNQTVVITDSSVNQLSIGQNNVTTIRDCVLDIINGFVGADVGSLTIHHSTARLINTSQAETSNITMDNVNVTSTTNLANNGNATLRNCNLADVNPGTDTTLLMNGCTAVDLTAHVGDPASTYTLIGSTFRVVDLATIDAVTFSMDRCTLSNYLTFSLLPAALTVTNSTVPFLRYDINSQPTITGMFNQCTIGRIECLQEANVRVEYNECTFDTIIGGSAYVAKVSTRGGGVTSNGTGLSNQVIQFTPACPTIDYHVFVSGSDIGGTFAVQPHVILKRDNDFTIVYDDNSTALPISWMIKEFFGP